ncbi:hypothetical protein ACFSX5_19045 [Devosia albogilva]|uniref:Uncharacterized protein n=1 Tax=Devosia albogilva TaxID=429726 RepID=A0ABW5QQ75_9HYPH
MLEQQRVGHPSVPAGIGHHLHVDQHAEQEGAALFRRHLAEFLRQVLSGEAEIGLGDLAAAHGGHHGFGVTAGAAASAGASAGAAASCAVAGTSAVAESTSARTLAAWARRSLDLIILGELLERRTAAPAGGVAVERTVPNGSPALITRAGPNYAAPRFLSDVVGLESPAAQGR